MSDRLKPITRTRLHTMVAVLKRSSDISPTMKRKIIEALYVAAAPAVSKPKRTAKKYQARVRALVPIIYDHPKRHSVSRVFAYMVHRLVTEYGAKPKAAACALIENGTEKGVQSLLRHYRLMKSQNQFAEIECWRADDGEDWFALDGFGLNGVSLRQAASRLPRQKAESKK